MNIETTILSMLTLCLHGVYLATGVREALVIGVFALLMTVLSTITIRSDWED